MSEQKADKIPNEEEKQKVLEALDAIKTQFASVSLGNFIQQNNSKLIECRHEIVISVIAHVLEDDDEGQTIGSKEICKKNYHIPVPSNREYNEYLDGFFRFLEGCMSSSVDQLDSDSTEDNNNG